MESSGTFGIVLCAAKDREMEALECPEPQFLLPAFIRVNPCNPWLEFYIPQPQISPMGTV